MFKKTKIRWPNCLSSQHFLHKVGSGEEDSGDKDWDGGRSGRVTAGLFTLAVPGLESEEHRKDGRAFSRHF